MSLRFRKSGVLIALAAASMLLGGCSTGSDTPSTTPSDSTGATTAQEPVTLEMSWWGSDERAQLFAKVIDLFEAKYPYITVKETPVGGTEDLFNRLATDFASGGTTAPDVFALGGAKPQEYGAAGALLDLGTVADIVHVDKYPDFSTTSATVDGKLYGLPTGGNATATFVNTDILKAAGIDIPTASWTWDDFIAIANKVGAAGLKNETGEPIYGVDLRVQDIIGSFAGQETQYGLYDWDGNLSATPEVIAKWYEIEVKLQEGKGLPDPTIVTSGWALPPDQQLYTLGQAALTFGYSNLIATYSGAGETIILPPPTATAKSGVALLPSAYWAINAASAHPKEAAMLVDWFLADPSAAALILDTRGVPFNPDTAAIVAPLLQGPAKAGATYVQSILDGGEVSPPQPNGGANLNQYSQDAESQVLFGSKSPLEAATEFCKKLDADIQAAK